MGFVVLHGKGARDERQTATLVKGKPLKYALEIVARGQFRLKQAPVR